jgi:hypothetical protein
MKFLQPNFSEFSCIQLKVDGMDGAFNKHGENEECLLQLEGKPEKKISLARHTGRCDDVIKPTSAYTECIEVALWQ